MAAAAGFAPAAGAEPQGAVAVANAFFERALDERLALDPRLASSLGLRTGYDRWQDASEAGDAERLALAERQLAELRARAAEALGERFDLREFHDFVLRTGSVPLTVLESEVQRWIEARKG